MRFNIILMGDKSKSDLPPLEERFLPPKGWLWGNFHNANGMNIRFGKVGPEQGKAKKAIVVGLQGLSEFSEKYFETARELQEKGIEFYMMDWAGQGGSDRFLSNTHKRHSSGFDQDVADLHKFMEEQVKPNAFDEDGNPIPIVMLAHSMGGNIGMRYLTQYKDDFTCAAFSAPMLDIYVLKSWPLAIKKTLVSLFQKAMAQHYAFGGSDWDPYERVHLSEKIFSSDPVRNAVHNTWFEHDPDLQVGGPTFTWVLEALKSCLKLKDVKALKAIKTPVLFARAKHEFLVSDKAIAYAAKHMPDAKMIDIDDCRHEILMENDDARNQFLNAFFDHMKKHGIKL